MKLQQILHNIEKKQLKTELPKLDVGDTIKLSFNIQEKNKQRMQLYEGKIIAKHTSGINTNITVRQIFQNIGVERVFAIHSPLIHHIEILSRAKVRKAKLYYLRHRSAKSTRLKGKTV